MYSLILVAQHLTLINKKTKSKFTGYHVEHMRKTLACQEPMEQQLNYLPANRPKNFKNSLFVEYHIAVKDCRQA
ncbi:hypothetical protein MAM1_0184d07476 [Mucor ambiguus]|uniref:Uncharacterized protein n=1 Tax=Mucor ambiguus TaxID=91626 RepID=A0A0C9MBJ1_9FUNG|nr:hypothetical protein MAM1_0184d07476 [Mucor ambiguus]